MKGSLDENRDLLVRLRAALEHDEQQRRATLQLSQAVRYDLAVRATEINGDSCLFPSCACSKADCCLKPEHSIASLWSPPRKDQ